MLSVGVDFLGSIYIYYRGIFYIFAATRPRSQGLFQVKGPGNEVVCDTVKRFEKFSLIFSISLLVICVNLLHP